MTAQQNFSPERLAKLADAEQLLEQAIQADTPTSMKEISRAVGKPDTWLQGLCHYGCERAIALRNRINAHNADLNQRYRYNRTLDRSRTQRFSKSPKYKIGEMNRGQKMGA